MSDKSKGALAFDLDGTLAMRQHPFNPYTVGEPVLPILDLALEAVREGRKVYCFTARASSTDPGMHRAVREWLARHGLEGVRITNTKTPDITTFYDDRAAQVIPDTGELVEKVAAFMVRKTTMVEKHDDHCPHCDHKFTEKGYPRPDFEQAEREGIEPMDADQLCPACKGVVDSPELTDEQIENYQGFGGESMKPILLKQREKKRTIRANRTAASPRNENIPQRVETEKEASLRKDKLQRMWARKGWCPECGGKPTNYEFLKTHSNAECSACGNSFDVNAARQKQASTVLGAGREGRVLDDVVRKLYLTARGAPLTERVSFMQAHPELFPRIYAHAGNEVVMEKLTDIAPDRIPSRRILQNPQRYAEELQNFPELLDFHARISAFKRAPSSVKDITQHDKNVLTDDDLNATAKDFRIRNNQTAHNIMQRADGSWVISDPVVWRNNPDKQNVKAAAFLDISSGVFSSDCDVLEELLKQASDTKAFQKALDDSTVPSDMQFLVQDDHCIINAGDWHEREEIDAALNVANQFFGEVTEENECGRYPGYKTFNATAKKKASTVPTRTGPQAILEALRRLDPDKLREQAMQQIKSGKITQRDRGVKMLNALEGLKRNDLKPEELMISRVPVLPPAFRPFAMLGNTYVPGDANELYQDLFKHRNLHKETLASLGERGAGETRLNMLNTVRALYGYGDPVSPKLKERAPAGYLGQILGTGPKHSFVIRKLLSKPLDNVGRSVITVDPDLDMNHVSIPRDMAWSSYGSMVQRRLVRSGMGHRDAIMAVKDRTRDADLALQQEMKERPLLISRAPAWHKFNYMGSYAKVHDGDHIAVNPYIMAGHGADVDGDSGRFYLWIRESDCGTEAHGGRVLPMTTSSIPVSNPQRLIHISEFPHNPATKVVKSRTVTEYQTSGTEVYALDPITLEHRWFPVSHFSVHKNLNMFAVQVGSRTLFVSDDHSLLAYREGAVVKLPPVEALNLMVPRIKHLPRHTTTVQETVEAKGVSRARKQRHDVAWTLPLNRDIGLFLGLIIGDGCATARGVVYLYGKGEKAQNRKRFEEIIQSDMLPYKGYTFETKFNATSIDGVVRSRERSTVADQGWFSHWIAEQTGSGALNKRIPSFCLNASDDHLIGVFDGLMSTDGSISWITKKDRACGGQLALVYFSSSPDLVAGLQALLGRFHVRANVCTYTAQSSGRPAYAVNISSIDIARMHQRHNLQFTHPGKNAIFQEHIGAVCLTADTDDLVPYPKHLHTTFQQSYAKQNGYAKNTAGKTKFGTLQAWKGKGHWSRAAALKHLELCDLAGAACEELEDFRELLADTSLGWEKITNVEPAGKMTGWDITVPGPYTFATEGGHFVQDTMTVHVPVLPDSVQEVKDKLMADKMLFSIKDPEHVVPQIKHEQTLGIWTASKRPPQKVHQFQTSQEALAAMERGDVKLEDEIDIPDDQL